MNPMDCNACEVTKYVSAATIGRLKAAIEGGNVLLGAWRLSDDSVVRRHAEIDAGCGCGCGPAD